MIGLELAKAGVFALLGGVVGFFIAPPIEQMNSDRASCRGVVTAENNILAMVANPGRYPARDDEGLRTAIDAQVQILRSKAGEMGVNQFSDKAPTGPGVAAVRDFLRFADQDHKNFAAGNFASSTEHIVRINRVKAGCDLQYSSLRAIPWNTLGLWSSGE